VTIRGTSGMRGRSSSLIGLQSGSAIAAAWRASSDIASALLQSIPDSGFPVCVMIQLSLEGFGKARHDDADAI
jgi:hypothetical protein